MSFTIIVTEEQRTACNAYLHSPEDYAWLHETVNKYDNIIDYSVIVAHCITNLTEGGWNLHEVEKYSNPEPLILDLSGIDQY